MVIDVPRTSRYQLIFYYKLSRYAPVTALVKFIPTLDSGESVHCDEFVSRLLFLNIFCSRNSNDVEALKHKCQLYSVSWPYFDQSSKAY